MPLCVHEVAVYAKPFTFGLAGITPCSSTLNMYVVPTVESAYTLTVDARSMLNIWLWQVALSKHVWA